MRILQAFPQDGFSYERHGEIATLAPQAWQAWTHWPADAPIGGPPEAVEDRVLLAALDRIERDLSILVDLETIASEVGLSPFHFHRRFAESMGETIGAYVRRTRLEHAATIICRTPTPILDAALRTGYNSQPAFTRAFARRFHATPSRLRAAVAASMPTASRLHHDLVQGTAEVRRDKTPLIAMRFHGGLHLIPGHWRRFARMVTAAGLSLDGAQPVGILYDDPALTAPERMRYDCALVDPGSTFPPLRAPLRRMRMRSGTYASLDVAGPHHLIAEAIFGVCVLWMPRAKRVFGDAPAYEVYGAPPWAAGGHFSARVLVPTDG
ncbi:helix-turn-helix domain-containing protein [Azorhizobium sp. AG788]|uniref:AraC family transcriptional regulator n=1 Tax=Azorhizobium sp. AG788 TaxID=2183897 RepID=UPI003138A4B5